MTLLDLLTAYETASADVLTMYEQIVYMRAALIWNRCHRPEWIAISRTELIRTTGIKSKDTIDKARRGLEEKGFIKTISQGQTRPRKWKFEELTTRLPDSLDTELPDSLTDKTRLPDSLTTRLPHSLKNSTRLPHSLDKATPQPKLGYPVAPSQREYTEANLSASSVHSNTYIGSRQNDGGYIPSPLYSKIQDVPKEVLDAYQDEIRPIYSHFELSKLADDVQHYGSEAVVKAIHRATLRNKRTLAYVEGILKRWETEGYDEEGKHAERSRDNRTTNDEDELDKWAEELTRGL